MLNAEAEIQFIALLNIQNILKEHAIPFKQSYKVRHFAKIYCSVTMTNVGFLL